MSAIDADTVFGMFGPIIAAAGLISGVWWHVDGKIEKVRTDALATSHSVEKELSDFKLKVATEYASWETVKAIETRLTERMDTLSEQVMKMPDAVVDRIMKYLSLNPANK